MTSRARSRVEETGANDAQSVADARKDQHRLVACSSQLVEALGRMAIFSRRISLLA
jgi:hypothetical protein